MQFAQLLEDADEVRVLFLHLLVVTPALLRLPRADEGFHSFENLVHSAHVPIHEVAVVYLQKPMIQSVLFGRPMPAIYVCEVLLAFPPPLTSLLAEGAEAGDAHVLFGVDLLELQD